MDEQITNNENLGMDPSTLGEIGAPVPNVENVESLDTTPVAQPEVVEEVGKTPPPKEKKQKPMSKGIFVLLIITLIAGVAYGVYYYLSHGNSRDNRVKTKAVVVNLGEDLPLNLEDYAIFDGINPDNCVLDTKEVDKEKEGTYNFLIVCGNESFKGTIEIKDDLELAVTLKNVYKTKEDTISAEDFILECNKSSCTYKFENEEEVLTLLEENGGPHNVSIIVTSGSKSKTVTGQLTVTDTPVRALLNCTSPSEAKTEINARKVVMDSLAIGGEGENVFLGIATRSYKYTFESADEYNKIKTEYTGKTEFDEYVGEIKFNDEDMQLILTVKLTNETLDLEYGSTFLKKYADIRSYYENTLGYNCVTPNS